jgi:excisionase family DNA binding protein
MIMKRAEELPDVMKVAEVAALLRIDPRTVRRMVRDHELDGNRFRTVIRISRQSVMRWLRHLNSQVGERDAPRKGRGV